MLSSKDLNCIFYDSHLDILFFPFVTISCVHPSLWIYITMIVIYLESYTRERSYISSWYPYSFMSTISFSFYLWWLCGSICCMSVCLTSLHLSALMFGEVCCPRACLDKPIISYLHHGLSQALIFNLLLVSLWTHLLDLCVTCLTSCVWEGHVWHLVSHLLKTMLMVNSHPYISLLKCFDVTHTHRFGCAYY